MKLASGMEKDFADDLSLTCPRIAHPSAAVNWGRSPSATLTSILKSSEIACAIRPQRSIPPTSVSSSSILTRLSYCTDRPVSDMPAPNMMFSGETLLLR